jgi:uracil-DNA glycosylase family 4
VRCVPPENKPTPKEIATCRDFLSVTLAAMTKVRAIVVLGRIAHETVITAQNAKRSAHPFSHGCAYPMGRATLFASYHCSRYNTSTRVLTPQMFRDVFARVRAHLDALA